MEKLEWLGYPNGEKNFEDIFIRFGATHESDGQTDGHRVTAIAALCIASHGKNRIILRCNPWAVGWSPESTFYGFCVGKIGKKNPKIGEL